eukprot:COSAG03_NODE_4233_length_1628_cov_5.630477_3_plen_76_part_00
MSLANVGNSSPSSSRDAAASLDLAAMPLVAELRHESALGTSLVAEKQKGVRRWVVVKWCGGTLAAVAGVVTALMH